MVFLMQKNFYFRNEAGEMDLITEFYSNGVEIAAHSAADFESQIIRICDEVVEDWQPKYTRMLINDLQYITSEACSHLVKDLSECIDPNLVDEDV